MTLEVMPLGRPSFCAELWQTRPMSRDVPRCEQVRVGRSYKKSVSLVEVEVAVEAGAIAFRHSTADGVCCFQGGSLSDLADVIR
jgi:hypothetical protein